jgi:hypothetical protein
MKYNLDWERTGCPRIQNTLKQDKICCQAAEFLLLED